MAENSAIEWTDHNPWMGCTKVSPACKNCYAEDLMDSRYGKVVWGPSGNRVVTSEANWKKPLKWNREADAAGVRLRVFCASLADVFEDWDGPMVSSKGDQTLWGWDDDRPPKMNDVRERLFRLIDATPNLDWLLLTKRPENILKMWTGWDSLNGDTEFMRPIPRPNVWLGTTVENQDEAEKRIPELLKCRDLASKLFLSCEPLLGLLDLSKYMDRLECEFCGVVEHSTAFNGQVNETVCPHCHDTCDVDFSSTVTSFEPDIDWVIAGGESGPNARPSHPDWFRSLRDQCKDAGVPFLFKQWGEWFPELRGMTFHCMEDDGSFVKSPTKTSHYVSRIGKKKAGRLLDGVEHSEFPEGES